MQELSRGEKRRRVVRVPGGWTTTSAANTRAAVARRRSKQKIITVNSAYDKYRTLYYIIIYIYVYFYGGCKLVSFHSIPPQPHAAPCPTVSHRVSPAAGLVSHRRPASPVLSSSPLTLSFIYSSHSHSFISTFPSHACLVLVCQKLLLLFSSHSHLLLITQAIYISYTPQPPLPTVLVSLHVVFFLLPPLPPIITYHHHTTGKHTGGGGGGMGVMGVMIGSITCAAWCG